MKPRSVRQVVESGLCAGCGLCEAIGGRLGTRMTLSKKGFFRPTLGTPLPPPVEREILALCPGVDIDGAPRKAGNANPDALWGPVLALHRACAADPHVRFIGSSGGVVTALLLHLLRSGQVTGVIQIGTDSDDPLANRAVVSRTEEEIMARAGSRYAPSAPLARLDDILGGEERFAIVAKPCDIAGLRRLALQDERVERVIPWMLSFFCAGVPSLHGTRELVERLDVPEADVAAVAYRGRGWPGRFRVGARDGRERSLSYAQSWGEVLSRHLQFRCKICPDGTGEFADISAADAWITADGYPDFDERDGWSAVLARTSRGMRLLRNAGDTGLLRLSPLSTDELAAMQPYQRNRKRAALVRVAAVAMAGGRVPRIRRMGLARAAIQSIPAWPRNFVGTFLRVLRGINRE